MADERSTVLGIRLDTEERKRFDQFVDEEGKNNKEFLNTLLNLYELNKGKVKNINLVGDIETLEGYTNKIHQTFINIIDKLESQKGDIAEHSQKDLQIYKEKVNNLEEEYEALKVLNSARQKELISINNDNIILKEQYSQLQENLQDKLTIIKEYQGKNDTLAGILEEYKGYKTEIETVKHLLADLQAENMGLSNINKGRNFTIDGLNKSLEKSTQDNIKHIEELKQNNIKTIEELNNKHVSDIEQLKDKASIKMDKALLELQKSHQEQLSHEQLKYNKDIQDYQNKYKSLLEELEKVRTIIPKAKKDNVVLQK